MAIFMLQNDPFFLVSTCVSNTDIFQIIISKRNYYYNQKEALNLQGSNKQREALNLM